MIASRLLTCCCIGAAAWYAASGRDESLAGGRARSDGTAWGVFELLERFVGARWYFPGPLGRSVPKATTLRVPPTWLEDAPVFRKREMWPPSGNPWNGTGTPLI